MVDERMANLLTDHTAFRPAPEQMGWDATILVLVYSAGGNLGFVTTRVHIAITPANTQLASLPPGAGYSGVRRHHRIGAARCRRAACT